MNIISTVSLFINSNISLLRVVCFSSFILCLVLSYFLRKRYSLIDKYIKESDNINTKVVLGEILRKYRNLRYSSNKNPKRSREYYETIVLMHLSDNETVELTFTDYSTYSKTNIFMHYSFYLREFKYRGKDYKCIEFVDKTISKKRLWLVVNHNIIDFMCVLSFFVSLILLLLLF